MGVLLKVILIFTLIYYLFRFLGRMLFGFAAQKVKNNYSSNSSSYQEPERKEGDVSVSVNSDKQKHFTKKDGDYVEYEEVE